MKKIMLTGAAGFIGRHVFQKLQDRGYDVIALVRPGTADRLQISRPGCVRVIEADLADPETVRDSLARVHFDAVLHIGAIRGGRDFPKEIYRRVNVESTRIIADRTLELNARMIFCSSVGVFGAIPKTLPAGNHTPCQRDTWYHATKIICEEDLKLRFQKGLQGTIIRPSITYGAGDYGFPCTLIDLVRKNLCCIPTGDVQIHLTDVDLLSEVFVQSVARDDIVGNCFIAADSQPVALRALVEFIGRGLGRSGCARTCPTICFRVAELTARAVHSERWAPRFQLISRSWYYDTGALYRTYDLPEYTTIPNFEKVLHWYTGRGN